MRNSYLTLCAVLLIFCGIVFAASQQKIKVAIVVDKTSGLYDSGLVTLLEVKLSEVENVELLERQQIKSILNEHKLSLSGMVKRENVVKAGKLLRADAILLLSLEGRQQGGKDSDGLLRVRIVETAHGIRLVDTFETADSKDVEQAAKRIAGKVDLAAKKLVIPPEQSIAIGIVDVQRAGLGDKHKRLASVLPALLSSRLSKEPRLIILEREDLKLLLDEKHLTTGDDRDFLNSAVLINGHIQPNGSDGLQLKLSIKGANKQNIAAFATSLNPDNPAKAIGKTATKIIQTLFKSRPTTQWNPKAEAHEFYRCGRNLFNSARHKEALSVLETANALQPGNVEITMLLFENEWTARASSSHKKNPVFYSDLELAEIVSLLISQIQEERESRSLLGYKKTRQWASLTSWKRIVNYLRMSASASTEDVRNVNRQSRKILVTIYYENIHKWSTYNAMNLAWASSDNPEQVMENLRKTLARFIMPPERGGRTNITVRRRYAESCMYLLGARRDLTYSQLAGQEEKFYLLWEEYLQELAQGNDPLMRFVGNLALARDIVLLTDNNTQQAKAYCKQALKTLPAVMETYEDSADEYTKKKIHFDMMRKYNFIVRYKKDEYLAFIEKIIEPMIENKEVDRLIVWDGNYCFGSAETPCTIEGASRYYNLMDRAAQVIQNAGRSEDSKVTGSLNMIRDYQARLKEKYPGIKVAQTDLSFPVHMLLSKKDLSFQPSNCRLSIYQDGHMLWIGFKDCYYSRGGIDTRLLAGIDLAKKETVYLWQYKTDCNHFCLNRMPCMAVGKKASYAYVDSGMVELPSSLTRSRGILKSPKILTKKNNLPSIHIVSMAWANDKLWMSYGFGGMERGLGLYDPKTETWEAVSCSTLKDDPVFDSDRDFYIKQLSFVPPDKIFFYACDTKRSRTYQPSLEDVLWKINTGTRKFEKVSVDVRKEMEKKSIYSMGPDLSEMRIYGTAVLEKNIWGKLGRSRLVIMPVGKGLDDAEILDNNILEGGKVLKFISTKYGLIAIGEGTVGLIETDKKALSNRNQEYYPEK